MNPIQNPIAEQLDALTRPLTEIIDQVANFATVEQMIEFGGLRGFVAADDGDGWRRATNVECTVLECDWLLKRGQFDVREPLPQQFVDWLRTNAWLMLRAAGAIETVTDDRDLTLIRDIVDGNPTLHPELEAA